MAKRRTTTTNEQRLAEALERITRRLGIGTLKTRGRDALDFHEVSVAALRDAVKIAFEAGYGAGFRDGEPDDEGLAIDGGGVEVDLDLAGEGVDALEEARTNAGEHVESIPNRGRVGKESDRTDGNEGWGLRRARVLR